MHERCRVVTEAVQNTYATVVVVQKYSRTKRTLDYVRSIGQRRRSRRITTLYLCVCCRLVNFDSLRNRWRLQKSSVGKLHQEPDLSRSSVKSCDAALLKRKPASIKARVSITEAVFLCWPEFDNAKNNPELEGLVLPFWHCFVKAHTAASFPCLSQLCLCHGSLSHLAIEAQSKLLHDQSHRSSVPIIVISLLRPALLLSTFYFFTNTSNVAMARVFLLSLSQNL
ncbi:unnamed protein product [Sphagnum troendelagicum]